MRVLNDSRAIVSVDASPAAPTLLVTPAAAAGAGARAGSDAGTVIMLAALLVCALGLNSLIDYCRVLDFGRRTGALTTTTVVPPTAAGADDTRITGGLKKRELGRIPVVVYEACKPGAASATDCAICLGEFGDGDKVRVLLRCRQGFHVHYIDLWLATRPSCPTCRNSLLIRPGRRHAGDGHGEATRMAGEETT